MQYGRPAPWRRLGPILKDRRATLFSRSHIREGNGPTRRRLGSVGQGQRFEPAEVARELASVNGEHERSHRRGAPQHGCIDQGASGPNEHFFC